MHFQRTKEKHFGVQITYSQNNETVFKTGQHSAVYEIIISIIKLSWFSPKNKYMIKQKTSEHFVTWKNLLDYVHFGDYVVVTLCMAWGPSLTGLVFYIVLAKSE